MSRVGRMAGALLVESEGRVWLVGFPKEPCDFVAKGVLTPGPIGTWEGYSTRVEPCAALDFGREVLLLELEGQVLIETLVRRLLIARNGSVSERLWRLLWSSASQQSPFPARFLTETPEVVWNVVRDAVLRCS